MAYIDVVAVKKAVKDGALITRVNIDGDILLADANSGEAAKIGELPVGRWETSFAEDFDGNTMYTHFHRGCGYEFRNYIEDGTAYCPNCGVMMKGENDG